MTQLFSILFCLILQVGMKHSASLTDIIVDTHRRKHLAYLMAEQGAIVNPESTGNLPKQVSIIFCVVQVLNLIWIKSMVAFKWHLNLCSTLIQNICSPGLSP